MIVVVSNRRDARPVTHMHNMPISYAIFNDRLNYRGGDVYDK